MVNDYNYYDNLSEKEVFDLALKGDKQALEYIGSLFVYSSDPQKCVKLTEQFWNFIRYNQYMANCVGYNDIANLFFNEKKVMSYTEQGANENIVECIYGLCCIYINGFYDITPDDKKAFYYAKKAAESWHPKGLAVTGMCYYLGKGVAQDYDKAAYYFNEAVGFGEVSLIMGEENVLYFLLPHYYEKNDSLVLKYAEYAIKDENPEGYYYAGSAYLNGVGVEEDITKATSYFFEGIKKFPNDPKQQLKFGLAQCLLIGFYKKEAFRDQFEDIDELINNLVDDMTEANDYKAFMLKGFFYQEGALGYSKDNIKALQCFRVAKAHGIADADKYIDELKDVVIDDADIAQIEGDLCNGKTAASQNNGKTEYEIIYENKKKKRLLTAAIICVVVSLLLRGLFIIKMNNVLYSFYFYPGEASDVFFKIFVVLKSSVLQYSYVNAIVLLSVMLIRRGKKAAVIGIFAAIGLLLLDLFFVERSSRWGQFRTPKILFNIPEKYDRRYGYWVEYLVFTVLSNVVSLVIYLITTNSIKTQTVWWYLISVYWSIALLSVACIIAVVVFGVLVMLFSNGAPSYSTSSSYGGSSGSDIFSNQESGCEPLEKQAKHIADLPGKYALFKQSIGWVIMDYYERIIQVQIIATGDLYNTYFESFSGERYYVPTSSVSDDSIYEAYKANT